MFTFLDVTTPQIIIGALVFLALAGYVCLVVATYQRYRRK